MKREGEEGEKRRVVRVRGEGEGRDNSNNKCISIIFDLFRFQQDRQTTSEAITPSGQTVAPRIHENSKRERLRSAGSK